MGVVFSLENGPIQCQSTLQFLYVYICLLILSINLYTFVYSDAVLVNSIIVYIVDIIHDLG